MLCELVTGSCDSIDDCALRVIRRFGGTALSSLPIALPPPTRIPCDPQPPSETLTGSIHDRHCERLRRDLEHRSTIDRSSVLDRSLLFLAPMLYCFGWLFCAAKVREFGAARNSPQRLLSCARGPKLSPTPAVTLRLALRTTTIPATTSSTRHLAASSQPTQSRASPQSRLGQTPD